MASNSSTPKTVEFYEDYVDFAALALQDADFAKVYNAKIGKIDFQDPESLQQLTKSLLKRDFSLKIELPYDRLCPPVPVRYNYVRWIQEILDTTSNDYSDTYDPDRQVIGIDIGTGASAIYPLLHTATRPLYRLAVTELDSTSHAAAARNIALNDLNSRIRLYQPPTADSPLIPLDALRLARADFVMCNPPFYTSQRDFQRSAMMKSTAPNAVCTGAEIEMIYANPSFGSAEDYARNPGGDVGFCFRIIEESEELKGQIQWFTCMMGKLESVGKVVEQLKGKGVSNWAVCCLRAGNKTRRWAVGWSWCPRRPRNNLVRSPVINIGGVQPFPTEQTIQAAEKSQEQLWDTIVSTLKSLDLRLNGDMDGKTVLGAAEENVWSRAARRKRARENATERLKDIRMEDVEESGEDEDKVEIALRFRVTVKEGCIDIRWLQGMDSKLFESFVGMLQRTVHPR